MNKDAKEQDDWWYIPDTWRFIPISIFFHTLDFPKNSVNSE